MESGTRLGPYEIQSQLGAGGMGEVYLAQDTRLGRAVAIKILPAGLTQDPAVRRRLEQEAKILAALSHPNVAAVHALDDIDGTVFIVLENIEGQSLAQQLRHRVPSVREALRLAEQIAAALEAAHHRGIVHRDLTPSNVMVTPDGTVKVLDFGIAVRTEPAVSDEDATTRQDLAPPMAGTLPYMSPEQARGQHADMRTDIWALGCILFELMTGQRAFPGRTRAETAAAVLEKEPDFSLLPTDTPAIARALLRRCLRKDRARRMHHAIDVQLELQEARAEHEAAASARPTVNGDAGRRTSPRTWIVAVTVGTATLLLGAGAAYLAGLLDRLPPITPLRATIAVPVGHLPRLGYGPSVDISPDGSALVLVLQSGTTTALYVKGPEDLEPRRVEGTVGAQTPFFSPDGQWIA